MPSSCSSVVVVTLYTLCVFVTLLRADYEVILDHKDVAGGYFSSDLKSTGLENADNPGANTYSIIGNFDAAKRAEYQIDNGAYKLKLQFTYADGTTDLLEWTQTSWITESIITGFSLIRAIGTDGQNYNLLQDYNDGQFRGLGLNVGYNSAYSYLDGNGAYRDEWWQAVGEILPWADNDIIFGIPAMYSSFFAGQKSGARSETLWISAPDIVSTTTAAPTTAAPTTAAPTTAAPTTAAPTTAAPTTAAPTTAAPTTAAPTTGVLPTTASATQYAECRPGGSNCHIGFFGGVGIPTCNSGFVSACGQPLTANCFLACNETSGAASAPGMVHIDLLSIAVVVTMVLLAVNVTLVCAQQCDKKQGNGKYRAVQFFASSEDEERAQLQMQV